MSCEKIPWALQRTDHIPAVNETARVLAGNVICGKSAARKGIPGPRKGMPPGLEAYSKPLPNDKIIYTTISCDMSTGKFNM